MKGKNGKKCCQAVFECSSRNNNGDLQYLKWNIHSRCTWDVPASGKVPSCRILVARCTPSSPPLPTIHKEAVERRREEEGRGLLLFKLLKQDPPVWELAVDSSRKGVFIGRISTDCHYLRARGDIFLDFLSFLWIAWRSMGQQSGVLNLAMVWWCCGVHYFSLVFF